VHRRLDHLLRPLLQDTAASNPQADRRLCHPVGTSQVQADAPPDQRRKRLVWPATPSQPDTLRPLDVMSWQRPNIGSRVTREGHARFWERPEVEFLRATRQNRWSGTIPEHVRSTSVSRPPVTRPIWLFRARTCHEQPQQEPHYSITSSARRDRKGGRGPARAQRELCRVQHKRNSGLCSYHLIPAQTSIWTVSSR
jgi:hypothetical protein